MRTLINVGDKVLLTTHAYFVGPDGRDYRAVHGTVKAVQSDVDTLGIKTNARSTNWYVEIGNVVIAGCQIFYAVKCDSVSFDPAEYWQTHDGKVITDARPTMIFNADGEG